MNTTDDAWTVARLARTLKRRVEDGFAPVWVRGELTALKRYPSGHLYFTLRDDTARVDCTIWKSVASRLRGPLTEGTDVFVLGTPSLWEERTSLRFNVVQVLPTSAAGAAAQNVERIKQALLRDGLLDPGRKRRIPAFATRIAVITSVAGAAVRDVIAVAQRRWPGVELFVVNSAVQGEAAPAELVDAIDAICRLERIDCCIIGRGGGGKEDLAAFNDEAVCRAIAACPVPVISAVGHEVDVTLADLVADVRAATPSQAAEFALTDQREVMARLAQVQPAMHAAVASLLRTRGERLERTRDRLASALVERARGVERRLAAARARLAPALQRRVRIPQERLAVLESRLPAAIRARLAAGNRVVGQLGASLNALSPLAVLGRGFTMARDEQGRVLRTVADFARGQRFHLRLVDGTVTARTETSND